MKINRLKPLNNAMLRRAALLLGGGILLTSCAVQVGTYTETDGVYYDPKTDILPESVRYDSGIDQAYEYDKPTPSSIAKGAQDKSWQRNNGYWDDRPGINTDWGTYAGTEVNVYDNSWRNYGWYSPYRWGWGSPFGWYGSYYGGMGWSMGFGWNSYFSPYYSPYYYGYSPYGYGMYGYGGMWGYDPYYSGYYGMGYPRYYYEAIPRVRSGAVNSFNRNGYGSQNRMAPSSRFGTSPSNNAYRSGGFRTENYPQNAAPRSGGFSREAYPNTRSGNWNNNNQGGFRSGSFNNSNSSGSFRSGGFSNGSSGGFGGSSGGGMRSSGGSGRTGGFR